MHRYITFIDLPHPVGHVFAWHEGPDALPALLPAFPPVRILQHEGIRDEAMAVFELNLGFKRVRWVAMHEDYARNQQFRDVQVEGPFKLWIHTHRFAPLGETACRAEDIVQYELRGGRAVNFLLAPFVRLALAVMFAQRHRALERALREAFARKPCAA
ncbi:MAG TPA: SRPBCC family protein [Kiritimatiellia bacterium]|nr:SRPBCC family protein [Kiritimatiellia bacterium]